ncbi:MAG TPA: WD40 repeat domain-containing protein, partial [Streptosporangiaceae bacterium]|nr:WD40 repeat domain-containing protein [Streptosporangiaceae bacterium]
MAVDDVPTVLTTAGRLVAVGGAAGTAWVVDAADGRPVATLTMPGGVLDLAFSPDGRHLVLAGPRGYALWHADDGRATVLASGRRSARVRWGDPGTVAVTDGCAAVIFDAAGRQLWRTALLPRPVADLAWLPGGGLVVASGNEVRCHARRQAIPAVSLALPSGCPTIAVSPSGHWICASGQDTPIHVRRTGDVAEITLPARLGKAAQLAFDDTGRWLAAGGSSRVTVWDFTGSGPQGRAPRILCAHDVLTALAWRPGSGTILATAGAEGTIALWNATAGKPGRPRITTAGWGLEDDVAAIAWNGRGMLVAATRNGTLR